RERERMTKTSSGVRSCTSSTAMQPYSGKVASLRCGAEVSAWAALQASSLRNAKTGTNIASRMAMPCRFISANDRCSVCLPVRRPLLARARYPDAVRLHQLPVRRPRVHINLLEVAYYSRHPVHPELHQILMPQMFRNIRQKRFQRIHRIVAHEIRLPARL